MNNNIRKTFIKGIVNIVLFGLWTILVVTCDVQTLGVNGTKIGFATFNMWFHKITGVNMTLYNITDWLGLVPLFICFCFGLLGLLQLIKRKSLFKVDVDILFLGVYYVIVIAGYLIFETIPINYRPILINGFMEVSYPSSTTLLVLSVLPTLTFQSQHRVKNIAVRRLIFVFSNMFSVFMVLGRLVSGVHWFTDIVGSCFLSMGLFNIYKVVVLYGVQRKTTGIKKK